MLLDNFLYPLAYLEYFLLYLIFFHIVLLHFCTDLCLRMGHDPLTQCPSLTDYTIPSFAQSHRRRG